MKNQKGMSFIGIVILVAIGATILVTLMKVVPSYLEYSEVSKAIKKISKEPNFGEMSKKEIADSFDKSATIDNITTVTGNDIEIVRGANGNSIKLEYQVVTPLFANVSVLLDFSATAP